MLKKHLIAKTDPVANSENLIFFKDFRITVIKDRLFRIERNSERIFNDKATQSVWFRNGEKIDFTVAQNENCVAIKTNFVTLCIDEDFEKSYAVIDGEKVKLNNDQNLKGTYRTLDGCFGDVNVGTYFIDKIDEKIPLENGVCSRNGVAVLDDSLSLILDDDGMLKPNDSQFDLYVFAYGNDYKAALNGLFSICGKAPLIPRYALGNWWSRYYPYSERTYLNVLNRLQERRIPITVACIDMDWHYSNDLDAQLQITQQGRNTPYYGGNDGWTGYTWNPELFPDYKRFLQELKKRNLKINLNLHPADGVRWFEDSYAQFAEAMGVDPETCEKIPFDITNERFISNYFEILHNPYEEDGVDFWWIDWQQGTKSEVEGLDPLWSLNHYHFLDKQRSGAPMILSRYCQVGSHRYPLGFSGDAYIAWESLDYLPYFTATASNVGYSWWSHDIGGHNVGIKDDELYLRYVQYGVFSPINRLHCTNWNTITKEPGFYMNGTGLIAEEFLRLRHKLIPYIYSANYRTHRNGQALVEPLYYYEPDNPLAYQYKNEYYFGGQLLVAPITKPSQENGMTALTVYLPKGTWTDIFTGDVYEGGREVEIARWLDTYPVFAKEGAVIVTSADEGNSCANPAKLVVDAYNGSGAFELIEDNEADSIFKTLFRNSGEAGKQLLEITFNGDCDVAPKDRSLRINFRNIPCGQVRVFKNGQQIPCDFTYDEYVYLHIDNIDYTAGYSVEVTYTPESKLEYIKRRALDSISRFEGTNTQKRVLCNAIMGVETEEAYRELIEQFGEKFPDDYLHPAYKAVDEAMVKNWIVDKLPAMQKIRLLEVL